MLTEHNVGLWRYEPSTDHFSFQNDFLALLGLDAHGISFSTLREFYEIIHPEDLQVFQSAMAEAVGGTTTSKKIRYRCVGKDGVVIWLEDSFSFHTGNEEEPTPCLYSFTRNVTEEQLKEIERSYLAELKRTIFKAMPNFIFVFDENFFFVDIIMSEEMSLLHAKEELIGSNGRNLFPAEVSDLYMTNIRECITNNELREMEYHLLKDGVTFYFQARLVPYMGKYAFGLIRDIGERVRRMDDMLAARLKAEESDRKKSNFLANMSHEIRTPLNAIVGFTELIAYEEDEKNRNDYMEVVRGNSELLLRLVNDILDMSRIESGRCEMSFEKTHINNLITEVNRIHAFRLKSDIELITILPEEEIYTYTDHSRITQVLFNFMSNAIKHTQKGSITLGMEEHDTYLKFYVTDTGSGISEENQKKVFDRFEKLNTTVQGTGLGLSISQMLVERLGGQIGVESTLGEGSTFYFTIPYMRNAYEVKEIVENNDITGLRRKRILVAEDVEAHYKQVYNVVYPEFDILWAKDGDQAVNMFILEKPDLILMDIRMPGMSGVDASKKIRTMSTTVPIIAATDNTFYMERQWALESGCNAVVMKPYSASKLKEVILTYI